MRKPFLRSTLFILLSVFVPLASPALAQTGVNGEIQGKVVDSSGAVLPGVAVTLSGTNQMGVSSVVSGETGVYRFPGLSAGEYRVQFELAGFRPVARSSVIVTVRATTTLNVTLDLASVEETVTVTGQSAVVDTANARQGLAVSADLLSEIPTAKDAYGVIALAPGAVRQSPSVGGSQADLSQWVNVNGTTTMHYNVNGAETSGGAGNGRYSNFDAYEEIVVETGGAGADIRRAGGGFSADLIPRQGGNEFHGMASAHWYNDSLVGDNLNDRLRANGLTRTGDVKRIYDISAQVGGPLWRDRIWFFLSRREYEVTRFVLGREELQHGQLQPTLLNLSFQTSPQNKFQFLYARDPKKDRERGMDRFTTYEASAFQDAYSDTRQLKYLRVFGQNTVLDAQGFKYLWWWPNNPQPGSGAPFQDLATGLFYNGRRESSFNQKAERWQASGSLSQYFAEFLGASHDVKVGTDLARNRFRTLSEVGHGADLEVSYQVSNGVPGFATLTNGPFEPVRYADAYSVFAQDRVSADRVTINLGVRFDRYNGWLPEQKPLAGVRWTDLFPPTTYPKMPDVLTWTNLSPRLSAIYQLTADGKAMVKASYGHYPFEMGTGSAPDVDFVNPNGALSNRYVWRGDLNGNGVLDPATELGNLLSTVRTRDNRFADDYHAPNVRETGLSFDWQLPLNLGLRSSYYHTEYVDQVVNTNVAIPSSAYTPMPFLDPGPDGVRGTGDDKTVNVYNRAPGLTGSISVRSNYPGVSLRAHVLAVTLQRRMANGWQMLGTYSYQHIPETRIGDLNDPNQRINDEGESALEVPHSVRLAGSYVLPRGGVQLSAMFNVQQGQPYNRTLNVTGLNQGTISIVADPTGTWRHDTQSQLDIRAEKRFRIGASRVIGVQLEAFNVFNNAASTIYGLVGNGTVTGGNFGRISGVMPPRTFRIGTRFMF